MKTSLNGVGVEVSYNSIIMTPNMTLPLMLPQGNSNLEFTFKTLRDTAVAVMIFLQENLLRVLL